MINVSFICVCVYGCVPSVRISSCNSNQSVIDLVIKRISYIVVCVCVRVICDH